PRADGAAFRLQEHRKNVGCRGILRQIRIGAARAIGELADISRDRATQLINSRRDQLKVGAIFETGVFTNLFVILVPGQVHSENGVVVIGCEFGAGGVDQLFDKLLDVDAARADLFHADALVDIAGLRLAGRVRFSGSHLVSPSSK